MVTYYRIYSRSREKYLLGTPTYSRWNDTGRLFEGIGSVRRFLSNTMSLRTNPRHKIDTDDWEIREYHLELVKTNAVVDIIKPEKIIQLLTRN